MPVTEKETVSSPADFIFGTATSAYQIEARSMRMAGVRRSGIPSAARPAGPATPLRADGGPTAIDACWRMPGRPGTCPGGRSGIRRTRGRRRHAGKTSVLYLAPAGTWASGTRRPATGSGSTGCACPGRSEARPPRQGSGRSFPDGSAASPRARVTGWLGHGPVDAGRPTAGWPGPPSRLPRRFPGQIAVLSRSVAAGRCLPLRFGRC